MEDVHDVADIASASQSCITAFQILQGHLSAHSVDKAEFTTDHRLATIQERLSIQHRSDIPGSSTAAVASDDPGRSVEQSDTSILSHETGVALARFRIWTGNLGALQRGTSSLDVRLREANVVRLAIVQILNSLQDTLRECAKIVSGERPPYEEQASYLDHDACSSDEESDECGSEDENDSTELRMRANSLKVLLAELYRLSFKIRNKSARGNNSRALTLNYPDKDTGIDVFSVYEDLDRRHVFEHLSSIRPPRETDKGFATVSDDGGKTCAVWPSIDTPAVEKLAERPIMAFSHMSDDFLAYRLARANTVRRRHFAYWRRHALKLSTDREPELAPDIPDRPPVTRTVTLPERTLPVPSRIEPTIISGTEATRLDPKVEDMLENETVISYATTVFGLEGDSVELPAPPSAAATQPEFMCDICHVVCPSKQGKGRDWRMHVLHDLQPYVCTYENCTNADALYASRNAWLEHERVAHRRFWQCHEHASTTFKSKQAFQEHLDHAHENLLDTHAKQIASFAEATEADEREQCPFCLYRGPFPNQLHNHMAFHQESIAAFTLTRTVHDATDNSASSRAQGSPSTTSLSEVETSSGKSLASATSSTSQHRDMNKREFDALVGLGFTDEEARMTLSRTQGSSMVEGAAQSLLRRIDIEDLEKDHAQQDVHPGSNAIAQWQQEIYVQAPDRHADPEEERTELEHDVVPSDQQEAIETNTMMHEEHGEDYIRLGEQIYRPEEMKELLKGMLTNIRLDDIFDSNLGTIHNCTSGANITSYIITHFRLPSSSEAERIGRDLIDSGFLRRIVKTNASHYQWTAKAFEVAALAPTHRFEVSADRSAPTTASRTPGNSYHEGKLDSIELSVKSPRSTDTILSDYTVTTIATSLQFLGKPEWATVPRLYMILRSIDRLDVLDDFIEQGVSDISFPFTDRSLPLALSGSTARADFLQRQRVVLSQVQLFELHPRREHANFETAESVPFHSIGWLGSGAHAHVDRVVSMVTHHEYARKTFRKPRGNRRKPFETFLKELQILKGIRHHHLVALCASYTDPKYFGLLMLPIADCTLSDYYDIAQGSLEKLTILRTFFGCLAEALRYLHENSIRHKDIKPKNILVKGDRVFLTDFGVAIDWEDSTTATTTGPYSVTRRYAAPEILAWEPRNTASDIWSLGCVFIEIFSVLKGSNVDALRIFLRPPPGTDSFDPGPDRVKDWLDSLRAQGDSRDNCIIKWVSAMLEREPGMRATATMLHDDIAKETEDSDLAFCGQCCMPENEVSEDEGESDYEDRAHNEDLFVVDDDLRNEPRHRTRSAGHIDFLEEQERWEQLDNERQMVRYRDRNHFGATQQRVRTGADRLAVPVYEKEPRKRRVSEQKGRGLVEEDPEWLDTKVDDKESNLRTQDDLQRWKEQKKAQDVHAEEGNAGQESTTKNQGGESSGIRYDTWKEDDNGKEYDSGYDKWQE